MLRSFILLAFWGIATPLAALFLFPYTFLTGDIDTLYWVALSIVRAGLRLAGVRILRLGLENLDPARAYIYMSNHVSNLDPPVLIASLPQRTSVMAKKELFRIPVLGRAMRMASLVPIDRRNKDAAISSVRAAGEVLRSGLSMVVFPEGTRSADGGLQPFKKGPFHMAIETGAAVVPVTVLNTGGMLPKRSTRLRAGTATVIFHPPVTAASFRNREELMEAVRNAIAGSLARPAAG
ncbi:MAG: 1-acyl-sn-glycerol-3-phosphate acyltransferase [Acidobacteria bacterium]|nr:1-acyl-sn-glycerol-3-phosphate acyltransferase [Acidobacteriota bacterium]